MRSAAERIARVHRLAAEKATSPAGIGSDMTGTLSTERVLAAAKARASETLGPNAPVPAALTEISRREEVERRRIEVVRLSHEGLKPAEIAERTGLTYGNVCKIRHDRGVSRRRSPRTTDAAREDGSL